MLRTSETLARTESSSNTCETAVFYRTQRGADVGDLFMSLVQTCRSNGVNPFDYMMAVIRNASQAKAEPMRWMPWNHPAALAEPSPLSA